jgi:hypothetical protein
MGDVVDGPWQRDSADLDAVDDDLLPELAPDPYGHEVELYEAPLRHPSQAGAVASTKSLRAVYSFWFHLFKSVVYLWRLLKAFIRGVAITTPALYRFYRVMHKHETAWIAKNNGQTGEARKAEDAQRVLFWVRLIGTVIVVGAVLYFGSTRLGEVVGTTQDGLRVTLYAMGGVALLTLIIIGARATDEPIIDGPAPRQRGELTEDNLNAAHRAAGILTKPTKANPEPDGVHVAMLPRYDGRGVECVYDLPASCGKSFFDVLKVKDRLAASFAVPSDQFVVERGAHEAQVKLWIAGRDPWADGHQPHPLLEVREWNIWDGAPFGMDVRSREIVLPTVYSSALFGARPRRGKSYAVRSALCAPLLDPTVRLIIANGKGDGTYDAAEGACSVYIKGGREANAAKLLEVLQALNEEMESRNDRIPGSKINAVLAEELGLQIIVLVIDEIQVYLEQGAGPQIGALLTNLAKVGPSSGFVMWLATQKPDCTSFPSGLRSMLGVRFCLQVMSWQDSDIILGTGMGKLGFDGSKLARRGVGWLRPDDDADGMPDDLAWLASAYDMDDDPWQQICDRAVRLRREYAPEDIVDAEVIAETPEARPGDLLSHVVVLLLERDNQTATSLAAQLPEPWAEWTVAKLGTELRNKGLRSKHTRDGNSYAYEDAVRASREASPPPSQPIHATFTIDGREGPVKGS